MGFDGFSMGMGSMVFLWLSMVFDGVSMGFNGFSMGQSFSMIFK